MQQIKRMLVIQQQELDDLTSELQRKEITPDRVIRLVKIVRRNSELLERMAKVLEAMGAPDLPETDVTHFLRDRTKIR